MKAIWVHLYTGRPQCLHAIMAHKDTLDEHEIAQAQERHQAELLRCKGVHRLSRPRVPEPLRLPGPQMPTVPIDVARQRFIDAIPAIEPVEPCNQDYATFVHRPLEHKCFFVLHLFSGQRRALDLQDVLESAT